MTQTALFLAPSEPYRNTDPATSRAAAATVDQDNDRALTLAALHAIGGTGTTDDVWVQLERSGRRWQRSCVSSRIAQLHDPDRYDQPPVRDSGRTAVGLSGKQIIVWEVTR